MLIWNYLCVNIGRDASMRRRRRENQIRGSYISATGLRSNKTAQCYRSSSVGAEEYYRVTPCHYFLAIIKLIFLIDPLTIRLIKYNNTGT